MSGEEDPFSGDGGGPAGGDESLEKRRKQLEQRERGLDDFADELDEREKSLDERERELDEREAELDERDEILDQREARIEDREVELDDRETAIEERERELSERTEELDEKEATLREFVGDNVREAVDETVSEAIEGYGRSRRLGTIGSLVLGLVGVTLIVGGVLNGFASDIEAVPLVFETETANLAVTVVLVFSGLAANLAAVAD
jgi:ribonuclease Y